MTQATQTTAAPKPDFANMSGSDLVSVYNEMTLTLIDLGQDHREPVKRFATRDAGVRRCESLHLEVVRALAQTEPKPAVTAEEPAVADLGVLDEIPDTTRNEAAPAELSAEPAQPNPPATTAGDQPGETPENEEETEEMAKRRKAATAGRKGSGRKARPRSTSGTTIREMTETYNSIVAKMSKAQREAAPWAKHHKSNFETLEAAKKQLGRLHKAIKSA